MASPGYPNYPHYGAPQQPRAYAPPLQPAAARPPKKGGSKVACGIFGCLALVVVIGGGGIGSCVFYTQWYLPGKAGEYLAGTEGNFNDVAAVVRRLESSFNKAYEDTLATGKQKSPLEIELEVKEAYALSEDLLAGLKNATRAMPEDAGIAEELDRSLKEYYDLAQGLGDEAQELIGFQKSAVPILKDMDAVAKDFGALKINSLYDITKASKKFRNKANDFEKLKRDFEKLKVDEDTKETRQQLVYLLDGMVAFLNEMAGALDMMKAGAKRWSMGKVKKAEKDSKDSEAKFKAVLDGFERENRKIDKKIRKKYGGKFNELNSKQNVVDSLFKALKEKHGL
ncbi:MAG: hypothetical protein ABIJ56_21295 [Pseudomonadota bacterium]